MRPTQEQTVEFFAWLWPNYVKRDLHIHLLPCAKSCPGRAVVGWDRGAQAFRILVDDSLDPQALFQTLWHEAGHVLNGDTRKNINIDWANEFALFRGDRTPKAARLREHIVKQAASGYTELPKERKADNWAGRMHAKWWPQLANAASMESAKHGARWILANIGKD